MGNRALDRYVVRDRMTFDDVLEHLAGWERRRVTVEASAAQARVPPLPPTALTMHGKLGRAQLGGVRLPIVTTATFALGPARPGDSPMNSFVLRSDEFVKASQITNSVLEIDSVGELRIRIQLD